MPTHKGENGSPAICQAGSVRDLSPPATDAARQITPSLQIHRRKPRCLRDSNQLHQTLDNMPVLEML